MEEAVETRRQVNGCLGRKVLEGQLAPRELTDSEEWVSCQRAWTGVVQIPQPARQDQRTFMDARVVSLSVVVNISGELIAYVP
jgi:hypothetical protein